MHIIIGILLIGLVLWLFVIILPYLIGAAILWYGGRAIFRNREAIAWFLHATLGNDHPQVTPPAVRRVAREPGPPAFTLPATPERIEAVAAWRGPEPLPPAADVVTTAA